MAIISSGVKLHLKVCFLTMSPMKDDWRTSQLFERTIWQRIGSKSASCKTWAGDADCCKWGGQKSLMGHNGWMAEWQPKKIQVFSFSKIRKPLNNSGYFNCRRNWRWFSQWDDCYIRGCCYWWPQTRGWGKDKKRTSRRVNGIVICYLEKNMKLQKHQNHHLWIKFFPWISSRF